MGTSRGPPPPTEERPRAAGAGGPETDDIDGRGTRHRLIAFLPDRARQRWSRYHDGPDRECRKNLR